MNHAPIDYAPRRVTQRGAMSVLRGLSGFSPVWGKSPNSSDLTETLRYCPNCV